MVSIFSKLYRFYSILVEIHPLQKIFFAKLCHNFLRGGGGRIFYFCHYFLCHNYPRGGGVSPKLINVTHFTVFFCRLP